MTVWSRHKPTPISRWMPLAIDTFRMPFGVDWEASNLALNACREAKAAAPQAAEGA